MSFKISPNFLLNFSERNLKGEEKNFYRFKSFRLDVEERQLLQNDSPVALTPKAFDVLTLLVTRSGHLVTKEELLNEVWSDSFVEEANLPRIVHTLRKVLGEDANGNKFVETVAKKGYRFVAEVTLDGWTERRGEAAREHGEIDDEATTQPADTEPEKNDEQSPRHRVPASLRLILFTIGFLTAISLIVLLSFNFRSKSSFNPNEPKSIAVLPLKSLSAENRDAFFELGIADALIYKLSGANGLVIRPLSATQYYADAQKDAVAIGKEQQVDYVLASNYQIADGRMRIVSQLINVSNGAVEGVFKDEQIISNSFAVQDAVTASIGQSLLNKLNRESNNTPKRYTNSEEAYRLYLQGVTLVDKRNRKDAEKAVEYLEQAVRLDPNYALAYARLANAYIAAGMFGGNKHEQYPKVKAAIEKALAIDENLAEAYSYLGEIKTDYEWDFDGAEHAYKKGIELNPNSAVAHQMYALYLNSMGRSDEAIAQIKTAIDLDPRSVIIQRIYGDCLFFARRYDEAVVQLERTIEMDPSFRTAYGWLTDSYKLKGEDDKAFEWFLRAPNRKEESSEKIELWKTLYAKSGWRGIYRQQIEEAKQEEKNGKTPYWEMATLYAILGEKEQAIINLEKAFQLNERGWGWTTLKVRPAFDSLRDDPRFQEIVRRVGLK